jgi:hypothetical protein
MYVLRHLATCEDVSGPSARHWSSCVVNRDGSVFGRRCEAVTYLSLSACVQRLIDVSHVVSSSNRPSRYKFRLQLRWALGRAMINPSCHLCRRAFNLLQPCSIVRVCGPSSVTPTRRQLNWRTQIKDCLIVRMRSAIQQSEMICQQQLKRSSDIFSAEYSTRESESVKVANK